MINKQTLIDVYYENVANNQIGGITDGISAEVAQDLGFDSAESTMQRIADSQNPDHIRPQDMTIPEPVAKGIPEEVRKALDRLKERTEADGRKFRISSQVSGRLAAKKFLDDQEKK